MPGMLVDRRQQVLLDKVALMTSDLTQAHCEGSVSGLRQRM